MGPRLMMSFEPRPASEACKCWSDRCSHQLDAAPGLGVSSSGAQMNTGTTAYFSLIALSRAGLSARRRSLLSQTSATPSSTWITTAAG